MDLVTCTKEIVFHAAHRVWGHENKCKDLHGHEYVAEITAQAPNLDTLGRTIDFGSIKKIVGGWIDQNLDHGTILGCNDPLVPWFRDECVEIKANGMSDLVWIKSPLFGQKYFVVPIGNPTAENLAIYLKIVANELLGAFDIEVTKVVVHETYSCYATAEDFRR